MNRPEDIRSIAEHYGLVKQSTKAIEEMAELTKAICKIRENPALDSRNEQYMNDVVEEIADVCIMAEQLRYLYGEHEVDKMIDFKLDRQLERICMGRD